MTTTAHDAGDRYPTIGPDGISYDRYRYETTADGRSLIYEEGTPNAWIQAWTAEPLDEWR
jgi:hypothetical protein